MKHVVKLYMILVASILSCTGGHGDLNPPNLTPVVPQAGDITLTADKPEVDADGTSYITVTMKINAVILKSYNEAQFDISPVGKFANGSTSEKHSINLDGSANAYIHSDTAGTVTVTAKVGTFSSSVTVKFNAPADPLTLNWENTGVPADNDSYA